MEKNPYLLLPPKQLLPIKKLFYVGGPQTDFDLIAEVARV